MDGGFLYVAPPAPSAAPDSLPALPAPSVAAPGPGRYYGPMYKDLLRLQEVCNHVLTHIFGILLIYFILS